MELYFTICKYILNTLKCILLDSSYSVVPYTETSYAFFRVWDEVEGSGWHYTNVVVAEPTVKKASKTGEQGRNSCDQIEGKIEPNEVLANIFIIIQESGKNLINSIIGNWNVICKYRPAVLIGSINRLQLLNVF